MANWGARIFENDDAMDVVYNFTMTGVPALVAALVAVEEQMAEGYVIAPYGQQVMSACALVAAGAGQRVKAEIDYLSPELDETAVEAQISALGPQPDLIRRCQAVVAHVVGDPERSELSELWSVGSDAAREDFFGDAADLTARLEAVAR